MSSHHLVRFGAVGHIGHFRTVDATWHRRGTRVILRTPRGLECGDVLAPPGNVEAAANDDGKILRAMTVEDHLIQARLQKHRDEAFAACVARLSDRHAGAVLVDVEYLFDGETLLFYFLGQPPAEVGRMLEELAESYEAKVGWRSFAEAATAGCGPGCGTEDATGPGCGSCATGCAVAAACSQHQA